MYKKNIILVFCLFAVLILGVGNISYAQFTETNETFKKKGYTLEFINKYEGLSPQLKERMVETFFTVYPKLAKDFNKNTLKKVVFVVDPAYDGVAATGGGRVVYSSAWLTKNPGDIDVVTHEVMHIVQNYPSRSGPWWVTEGIADYVRYKYGVDNEGGGWALPDFKPTQKYTDSYRVTARFFAWIEKHHKGFIKKLDKAMREKTYSEEIWQKETGKTIDELWSSYATAPAI